jgi:hypothetical protein
VSDTREAWNGTYPDRADLPVRVEAAAYRGRVTHFDVSFPWTRSNPSSESPSAPPPLTIALIGLSMVVAVALVARHNVATHRGDIRGAFRIALFIGCCGLLSWILAPHHGSAEWVVADLQNRLLPLLLSASVMSAFGYLAIEPWVRRHWPQTMITWSRFLAGRWQDPMVGRDFLVGVVWAIVHTLLQRISALGGIWLGAAPPHPTSTFLDWGVTLETLMGSRAMTAELPFFGMVGFVSAVQFCFVLFLFRALLRKPWLAVVVCFIVLLAGNAGNRSHPVFDALSLSISLTVLVSHGLLATMVFMSVMVLTDAALLTLDLTAWYGQGSLVAVIVVSVLAVRAFRVSLGERPLFVAGSVGQ